MQYLMQRGKTAIKSLKIGSVALEARTSWYQGERHSSACRDGGRSEDLKAGSNLICSVYDSVTLLIILRVKPISPDCVQLVSRRSSMVAAEPPPKVCRHNVTLEDVKNKNGIFFFSSASSSCDCLINQNALKWITWHEKQNKKKTFLTQAQDNILTPSMHQSRGIRAIWAVKFHLGAL